MKHEDDPQTQAGFALLTTFGLGHLRPASGTWGSLPPVLIAGLLIAAGLGPGDAPVLYHAVLLAILVVFGAACVVWGDRAEARYGKDPSEVVADETSGQCIPLMLLPAGALATPATTILTLAAAFLLFRALDILKPPPANEWQQIPGGWGVLVDDLIVGLYALLILQAGLRLFVV